MATPSKSRRIELRVSDEERRLEEAAAAALGVSLSEFVRQAARGRAQEVLQERSEIVLAAESARRFLEILDEEAPPPPGMRELFKVDPPWEA